MKWASEIDATSFCQLQERNGKFLQFCGWRWIGPGIVEFSWISRNFLDRAFGHAWASVANFLSCRDDFGQGLRPRVSVSCKFFKLSEGFRTGPPATQWRELVLVSTMASEVPNKREFFDFTLGSVWSSNQLQRQESNTLLII